MSVHKKIIRACVPRSVRGWLRSPSKTVEWAWSETKYAAGINQSVYMRPDWLLRCHPAAYRFAYWAQKTDKEQVAEFDGFISSCYAGMRFFDIGAHFGLFSLAALHYGGADTKAVAVDPSPTATRMMLIQAGLNNVKERLSIVQSSVGSHVGQYNMVTVGVISGGYMVAASEEHSAGEVTCAQATTLDKLAQDFDALPTHIKIDVEGDEAEVIRGGRHVLSQAEAPQLFLELHNKIISERRGNPLDTLTLLKELDYKIFAVDGTPLDTSEILNKPLIRVVAKRDGARK